MDTTNEDKMENLITDLENFDELSAEEIANQEDWVGKTIEECAARKAKYNELKSAYGRDWYVVMYADGEVCAKHHTMLSNILECGHSTMDYGISKMERCIG